MHRLQNSILQQSTLLLDVVQSAAELDWFVDLDHIIICYFLAYIYCPIVDSI